jgi:hypothetical protein
MWDSAFWNKVQGLPGAVAIAVGTYVGWFALAVAGGDWSGMLFGLFTFGIVPVVCLAHMMVTIGGVGRRMSSRRRVIDVVSLCVPLIYLYLVWSGGVSDVLQASGIRFAP